MTNVLGLVGSAGRSVRRAQAGRDALAPVKNPRFGDVPSEPEYIWVEEDKVPTTLTTLIRGKGAIIAAPEIVARYGAPPGGGKISPRQGIALPTATARAGAAGRLRTAAARHRRGRAADARRRRPRAGAPKRGFVVYVDTTRIVDRPHRRRRHPARDAS